MMTALRESDARNPGHGSVSINPMKAGPKKPTDKENIASIQMLVATLAARIKVLEEEKRNALKWGISTLGMLVLALGTYIWHNHKP